MDSYFNINTLVCVEFKWFEDNPKTNKYLYRYYVNWGTIRSTLNHRFIAIISVTSSNIIYLYPKYTVRDMEGHLIAAKPAF